MGIGGAEMLVARLSKALDKEIFNPIVCSLSGGESLRRILEDSGVECHDFRKTHGKNLSIPLKILRFIKEKDIDIVHTHCIGPLIYSHLSALLCKKTVFIHTEHINIDKELSYSKKHSIYARYLFRYIDGFVSIAPHLTEYFRNKYQSIDSKITTIPNGIDIKYFDSAGGYSTLREEIGMPEDAPMIGNISALRPQKNHKTLITAVIEVLKKVPEARLVIAGTGELEEDLKGFTVEHGLADKVFFLGYRNDVASLLREFDVFVLPSYYEGLPLCLLEAAAAGVPIVCSDIEGNSDIVKHGVSGLCVSPFDVHAMADAIVRILTDPVLSRTLSFEARSVVRERFDFDRIVSRYEEYYIKTRGVIR